jgi:phage terminase large subunit-like protein
MSLPDFSNANCTATNYTKPLSPEFPSEADWLLPIVEVAWKTADDPDFTLDVWQADLIRRVLEVYPDGHERAGELRYRQCVISMGRQNGKSVLGAIFGLYGLLRSQGQMVVGIASSADQARVIYERTMHVIRVNPSLAKLFTKLTDTRGIRSKDGGKYEIKAATGAALQGIPVNMALIDELHLLKSELWTSLVNGAASKKSSLVLGITTAGDENSTLLKDLYEAGAKAVAGDKSLERFGFFEWCAPEARVPDNDDELLEYLKQANPALACGRIDYENVLSDVRAMPAVDVIRYRLNKFVSASNNFIALDTWLTCGRPSDYKWPEGKRPVFAIDRSPDWGYATIAVAVKDDTGTVHTEVVASIVKPNLSQLVDIATRLTKHSPQTFVVDGYGMRDLANELKRRGMPVNVFTQGDIINASSWFFARATQKKIVHANDPLLSVQLTRTVRKNVGDSYRISRKDSSTEIDAVMATVCAMYATETRQETTVQVF